MGSVSFPLQRQQMVIFSILLLLLLLLSHLNKAKNGFKFHFEIVAWKRRKKKGEVSWGKNNVCSFTIFFLSTCPPTSSL